MRKDRHWMTLLVLLALICLPAVGCQSQPQDTAAIEPADEAAAGEPAASETEAPAAEPARIPAEQLVDVFQGSDVLLLDVRTPEEIEEQGTVEGYLNIPIDELEARLDELPRDRPILTA